MRYKPFAAGILAAIVMFSNTAYAESEEMTSSVEIVREDIPLTDEIDITSDENSISLTELNQMDEKKRKHKEAMIRERVIAEIAGVSTQENEIVLDEEIVQNIQPLPDINPELFYTCYDGMTDYVLTDYGNELYVFYVRITADGEYFLSRVNISETAEDKFRGMMTPENRYTTEQFWNKVALSNPESGQKVPIRPIDQNGVMLVPYFNQGAGYYIGNGEWTATDWPQISFNVNGHTMQEAGCGFFSTAMALSYMKQRIIAPPEFKENGQYIADEGSAVTVGVATAEMYGVHAYFTSDINEVIEALRNGHPVMEHVGPSVFTGGGHYILLVGYTKDGMFAVNDPGHKDNSYFYNGVTFPQETIVGAAKDITTAFTIFD